MPNECKSGEDLLFLNNFYKNQLIYMNLMSTPADPIYSFPRDDLEEMWQNVGPSFYITCALFAALLVVSVIGYGIGKSSVGNKGRISNLVEAIDEDNPHRVSTESRKKRWALFLYSFSISRNFREIFIKPYKSIRDRKFDVFDGLRVQMVSWIILGHVYLVAREYGQTTKLLKKLSMSGFLPYIVMSGDFAISFLYFMSGFIGMFALIKKFQ